mmetsp:Transcript_24417/g.38031  ORF Transcript_24417/g.38031 Transcript_24417/m.38031 type:complete len:156 (-) Transcript_24417:21-488(-)
MRAGVWILSRTKMVDPPQPKIWTVKEFCGVHEDVLRYREYDNVPEDVMSEFWTEDFHSFCTFKVRRYPVSSDVCGFVRPKPESHQHYIVGTSSKKMAQGKDVAPSKIMAFIAHRQPELLPIFSSSEQQVAKKSQILPTLPTHKPFKFQHTFTNKQ